MKKQNHYFQIDVWNDDEEEWTNLDEATTLANAKLVVKMLQARDDTSRFRIVETTIYK